VSLTLSLTTDMPCPSCGALGSLFDETAPGNMVVECDDDVRCRSCHQGFTPTPNSDDDCNSLTLWPDDEAWDIRETGDPSSAMQAFITAYCDDCIHTPENGGDCDRTTLAFFGALKDGSDGRDPSLDSWRAVREYDPTRLTPYCTAQEVEP